MQKGIAETGDLPRLMSVSYESWPDGIFGGKGAIAFELHINNVSDTRLTEVHLTIDQKYTNDLSQLLYHRGFIKGGRSFQRDFIEPNESIAFIFSHDVSNHAMLQDTKGNRLPNTIRPTHIRIETQQGAGTWTFVKNPQPEPPAYP